MENESENLGEILKQEAERINSLQESQEESFENKAGKLALNPQRAKSAAELLENIKDPKIEASLLALAGFTPGTEEYKEILAGIPDELKEVADNVMPATWNAKKEEERRLCDWILFNNSVIDEKTGMGIDFEAMPDSLLGERMTASSVFHMAKLKKYQSQEEFTKGFSERIKRMMMARSRLA